MTRLPFSRKPERLALARKVAAAVTEATGQPAEFDLDYLPGELHLHLPKYETVNGPFAWANFEVCERGLSVHIRFEDAERAASHCYDINPYSGKWNHYLWPRPSDGTQDPAASILAALPWILDRLAPLKESTT